MPVRRGRAARTHAAARRRSTAPRPTRASPDRRDRLERLLVDAVRTMDEEGLVFLLRQAHLLSSRTTEERINREIEEYERSRGRAAPEEAEEAEKPSVRLEPTPDGKSYVLAIGGQRKMLTRGELGEIVKACLRAPGREAAGRALYRRLGQERGDILVDAKITGPASPLLAALYDTVLDLSRQAKG